MKLSNLFLAGAIAAMLPLAGCGEYSTGERYGEITKFSKKGIFCKTWEGEMVLGGFRNSTARNADGSSRTNLVANVFEFTVEDPKLIPLVEKALENGEPIALQYSQEWIAWPCRTSAEGNYFITGVGHVH